MFLKQDLFEAHLQRYHPLLSPEIVLEKTRLCQLREDSFWCGFCQEIKCPESPADEKYNHVEAHFIQEGLKFVSWVVLVDSTDVFMRWQRSARFLNSAVSRVSYKGAGPEGTKLGLSISDFESHARYKAPGTF